MISITIAREEAKSHTFATVLFEKLNNACEPWCVGQGHNSSLEGGRVVWTSSTQTGGQEGKSEG